MGIKIYPEFDKTRNRNFNANMNMKKEMQESSHQELLVMELAQSIEGCLSLLLRITICNNEFNHLRWEYLKINVFNPKRLHINIVLSV